MSANENEQPAAGPRLDEDPVDGAVVAGDYPHDENEPGREDAGQASEESVGGESGETDYERTRSIPDGSSGGRFEED